jgi:MFS family permease
MKKIYYHNFYISILLTGALFSIVLFLFNPSYNTDVDIYFLYTLSGGYGNEPSALLHYSYGWHPLLSGIITYLFRRFPAFNWYSFSLVLFHFISCISLLLSFLHYFRRRYAIGAFIIFFFFIEGRLLIGFNFSGAALIGVMSGSISLLLYFIAKNEEVKVSKRKLFFFLLLIFIGGLLRLHYMALFSLFAAWMGLFFLPQKKFIHFLKIQFFLGLLLVISFLGQRYYFQKKIPGWNEEEKMRKAWIYINNHPHKESVVRDNDVEKIKENLISISFLYDNKLTDYNAVKDFGRENVQGFKIIPAHFPSPYWLFMDARPYLFLFTGMIIFFIINKNQKLLTRFICVSLFYIIVFMTLWLFFKITEVIFLTMLASVLLSAFLCLGKLFSTNLSIKIGFFLALLSCTWMMIRFVRFNDQHKQEILYARGIIKELNEHNNILFVDAGSFFNFHLSIWDVPGKYPIHNLVYNELFLSNSYKSQFTRYGITNLMKEIPVKDNIYLTGQRASILTEYYRLLYNQTARAEKIPGFKFFDAYRIRTVNNK